MVPPQVTVQWRKGQNGDGGTYTFDPIPEIQRSSPNLRQAVFTLPLADGAVIQTLGQGMRTIILKGVLYTTPVNFNILDAKRESLISGIGTGTGQLHIIAPSNHVYYIGIPNPEGIQFDLLRRSNQLDYSITITTPDPTEYTA